MQELLSLIPHYDPFETAGEGHYFDEDAAQLALDFFPECLTFIEGEKGGQPFDLEPHQASIIGNLFGWKRADGTRRYREALLYVPRKNGKTPLAAGITLLVAFTDDEPGGQLFSIAAEKEQASLIHRHCAGMIAQEPELSSRAKVYNSYKSFEIPKTLTTYKALSSDASTKHGLSASLVVADEVHAHKDDGELIEVMKTSTAARRQPLILYTTTADFDGNESYCNRLYDYARSVQSGVIEDPSFLPVIYEAEPEDDWTDPKVWAKANPNLGVSVSLDYMERQCKRAQNEPTYEPTFRRLHLNQRVSQAHRWLSVSHWRECQQELPDLCGRECYGGLDLSSTTDFSAFVLHFPPLPGEDCGYLLPFFFLPEARLQDHSDRVPYETWARQGSIEPTPGNVVDYAHIRAKINDLSEHYSIQEIRYDPWNATHLATQLSEQDGFPMTEMRQGYRSMNAPTKELEKLVLSRGIAHGGNPVLTWMIQSAQVRSDPAGNIKPDKARSRERIDGVVASIMALSGGMAGKKESVYQQRGAIWL